LLCKEKNVRAGRITAAGKMKETVVVTVHKEAMKIMDSSKIMDDRVVDNRRITDTAKKMAEEECKVGKVAMDNREGMDNKEVMDRDSAAVTAVNKEATGASRKDMVECRVASVAMARKASMVSKAGMADNKVDTVDSKVVTVDMANKAAGVVSKAATAECKVAMEDMVSKAAMGNMDRVKKIMMMTTVACRDVIVAGTMKTSMKIIAAKKKTMTIMRCRAAMAKKEKKDLMKMKKAIMTGNNSRGIPAGVLAVCSTIRANACMAWAANTDRNMNTIAARIITVAAIPGKIRMKGNMVAGHKDRRETAVWAWAEAAQVAPAPHVVALPACQEKKYVA
jgi:hypothetical protein